MRAITRVTVAHCTSAMSVSVTCRRRVAHDGGRHVVDVLES